MRKFFIVAVVSITLFGCTTSKATPSLERYNEMSISKKYSYFNPSFDFISFSYSDFNNCNKQRFNYIMTVKLQATQRSEFSDENMLVYDYRPSFNYYQDFQVIIIGEFSNDGILHCLRMTVPRNATLQQEGIRLSHFKTFDNLEEYLSSAYEEPWLSYNNILKKDTKTDNELYEAWLSAGERLIENGRFISRWYNTLILNDGQEIDVMALKMTPDIELEIYPILMKEYIEYRSEKE